MPIHLTARWRIRPEARERCAQAIRANEPNTLLYTAFQSTEDPTRFLHYFIFKDAAAELRHSTSEGVQRFTAVLYPECLDPYSATATKSSRRQVFGSSAGSSGRYPTRFELQCRNALHRS